MELSMFRSGLIVCIFVAVALMSQKSAHGKTLISVAGPFISCIDRIRTDDPRAHVLPWRHHLRISHFNPNKPKDLQILNGNITGVNITLDDTCWVKIVMDVWSNNQWKANAFIFDFKEKGCRAFRTNLPGLFKVFFKQNLSAEVCRVPPGVYVINNEPVDLSFPHFPVMFYGSYKFQVFIGRAKDLYLIAVAETKLIPRFN